MKSQGHKAIDRLLSDRSPRAPRRAVACAALFVIASCNIAVARAKIATASVTEARQFLFDIPAQPLATALEAYTSVTGIETLYDSTVAYQRRSEAVLGSFTAVDALRTLLSGTSLLPRSISEDSVTIELPAAVAQTLAGPPPEQSRHRVYYSSIQLGIERAFCRNDELRPGSYRAVLKFAVTPNGLIRQPNLVGSTGNADRDRLITDALDGIPLGSPPPADLPQPIMMIILPQSSGRVSTCAGSIATEIE